MRNRASNRPHDLYIENDWTSVAVYHGKSGGALAQVFSGTMTVTDSDMFGVCTGGAYSSRVDNYALLIEARQSTQSRGVAAHA